MALFRTLDPDDDKPDSPVLMFRDLKRDPSVKYLWGHQEKTLDAYMKDFRDADDIAIELPTGTGKTLVGLLIAEFRRRAFDERVAFLCSTRQICAQVDRLAALYGIPTSLLVGPQADYDPAKFSKYQQGRSVAITTYSGIFNVRPKISDPQLIVCDDAHSAEDFVSSMWTLRISRFEEEDIFLAVYRYLKAVLPESLGHRIENYDGSRQNRTSVDLISVLALHAHLGGLRDTLSSLLDDTGHIYSWRALAPNLAACSLYFSPEAIEIRPVLAPTRMHKPFADARQRIYMSATLGDDGDIERSFGVAEIKKLPVPEGWDRRGTGRRLMLFPGVAPLETQSDASVKLLQFAERDLILTPDKRRRDEFAKQLKAAFTVLISADTEADVEKFRRAPSPVALILANRYDGIDFPGKDCHCMLIYGLPTGAGLQETYLVHRLNAVSQLRDRIRTRVTQAVGRCTRDESDFAVVIVEGSDLVKLFCTRENVDGMHPELQAEISFGLQNSEGATTSHFIALAEALLKQTNDWQEAESDLKQRRLRASKKRDPLADVLFKAAKYEIEYVYALWGGHFTLAYKKADAVLAVLVGSEEIRPYRTFWEHQAAVAAFLAWKQGAGEEFKVTAIRRLENAAKNNIAIHWLGDLIAKLTGQAHSMQEHVPVQEWFEEINAVLEELGIKGGKFAKRVAELRTFIASTNPKQFHQALEWLGRFLGAKTKQWTNDGAPDGLWLYEGWAAFLFEAKTEEFSEGVIGLNSIRQANSHVLTARHDKSIPSSTPTYTAIISPRETLRADALPHVGELRLIGQQQVVELFDKVAGALEEVRMSAPDASAEQLRVKAIEVYQRCGLFPPQMRTLITSKALSGLRVVK